MTSPVTIDPSIHDDRAANNGGAAASSKDLLASITQLFQEIPKIIIDGAIALIKELTGIDFTGVEQFFESFTSQIGTGLNGALDFIRAILQPLVDGIIAVLGPIPIIGTAVETLANFLGLTHTTANTGVTKAADAQYSADTANAGVAILNAKTAGTGTVFTDTFNRPAAGDLGPGYTRFMGSGSGTWGTDGSGNVHWSAAGSTYQTCVDLVNKPMVTDYQSISTVLTSPELPPGAPGASSCALYLYLRCDITLNNYVYAAIDGNGFANIGYVLGGALTQIGPNVSISMGSGDLWEFRVGTSGNLYEFDLLQNNVTVCTATDTGHNSHVGAIISGSPAYAYGALGVKAGTYVTFFITGQNAASDIQVLTVADRTP